MHDRITQISRRMVFAPSAVFHLYNLHSMTESLELAVLSDVTARLESAGFEYMLTGSVAMNYYSQPRMTRDIDIVVSLVSSDSSKIVEIFKSDYYVSADAVSDAARQQSMFNIVHLESVVKVDFIVKKDTEYRRLEFERRQQIRVGAAAFWIVSKEDLILSKLCWALDSRSELQLGDVRNLLSTNPDIDYLNKWSSVLEVNQLLQELIDE